MADAHELVLAYCHRHGICSSCKRAWAVPWGKTCTACLERAKVEYQKQKARTSIRRQKQKAEATKAKAELTAGWSGWERKGE